jgi:hypothetical protein
MKHTSVVLDCYKPYTHAHLNKCYGMSHKEWDSLILKREKGHIELLILYDENLKSHDKIYLIRTNII